MDAIYLLAVPLISLVAVCILYPVFYPITDLERVHKAQQEALKRHKASHEADTRRIQAYWAERGKTLKPMDATRYCDQLNEQEPLT